MRVIAGFLGGQNFDSPNRPGTHPMSDKIRGALFNVLGDIEGLTVLDAFAGSGALAIEAISRGAANVVAIESDKIAHRTITKNIQKLELSNKIQATRAPISAWLLTNPTPPFDIILVDPPHDELQLPAVQDLAALVKPTGVFVLSWPSARELPELHNLTIVRRAEYGNAQLVFYKHA